MLFAMARVCLSDGAGSKDYCRLRASLCVRSVAQLTQIEAIMQAVNRYSPQAVSSLPTLSPLASVI